MVCAVDIYKITSLFCRSIYIFFFSWDGHCSHTLFVTERILNTRMSSFVELAFMHGQCFVRIMLHAYGLSEHVRLSVTSRKQEAGKDQTGPVIVIPAQRQPGLAQTRQSVRIFSPLSLNLTRNSSPHGTNILFCKDHFIMTPLLWSMFYFPCFTDEEGEAQKS